VRESEKSELDLLNRFIGAQGTISAVELRVYLCQHSASVRVGPQVDEVKAVVGIEQAHEFPAGVPTGPEDGRSDRHLHRVYAYAYWGLRRSSDPPTTP
jgi:hypothetical protein